MALQFKDEFALVGIGGSLVAFNLELERSGPAPAPLPSVWSVVITRHYEDTVEAAVPLRGVSGGGGHARSSCLRSRCGRLARRQAAIRA